MATGKALHIDMLTTIRTCSLTALDFPVAQVIASWYLLGFRLEPTRQ